MISLKGIDSASPNGERYLAQAVYRHMTQTEGAGPVFNATLLGGLALNASENHYCWTGPHVHQGVGALGAGITLEHDIEGYPYPNCPPWIPGTPYPGAGWTAGYPFCYQIRWNG